MGKPNRLSSISTLDVGQEYIWEEIEYTIIGRVSFVDGEGDPAQKDYLLFHPQFGTLWATEYWGTNILSPKSRLIPPKRLFRERASSPWQTVPNGSFLSEDPAIEQVDGALPYIAQVGDQVDIAEFKSSSSAKFRETLSIEQTKGLAEVECSISQRIHEKQWKIASGQYTEADARREARRHMPWWGRLVGLQRLWLRFIHW